MRSSGVRRRLAAILAADVAGYSRLMGADEARTLEALKRHVREVFEPKIQEYDGRIFKTMGDGLLAAFNSVVDAVECAVAVQQEMAGRNLDVPDDRRLAFRIGIHIGDVIVEGTDLYGDGINVAARLQALAEPGGICVSRIAREQVRDKVPIGFADGGEQRIKNIAQPIHVFHVTFGDGKPAAGPPRMPIAPPLPDKPSIVVLAFENMGRDPDQDYFSDGIAEDIITELSKISSLFVIARNSAFAYKGKPRDLRQVSRELGVRYVLEGSVRKAGDRVRVTAQLIDGTTGGHLWAERYDRDLTDIFEVQDEITANIVGSLRLKLTPEERLHVEQAHAPDLEAYDCFMRGRELAWRHTSAANEEAKPLLERAIALDPDFAPAHAMLAYAKMVEHVNRWSLSPDRSLAEAVDLAETAQRLDPTDPFGPFVLGTTHMWRRELDEALALTERSLELDPNFALGHASLGLILIYAGRPHDAIEPIATAMRLDPLYPDLFLHFLGMAYFMLGRYRAAAEAFRERLRRNPETDATRAMLASSCGHLGLVEEARGQWTDLLRLNHGYSIEARRAVLPFKNPEDFDRIVEGLAAAGLASAAPNPGQNGA